jgi:hypothetical protein
MAAAGGVLGGGPAASDRDGGFVPDLRRCLSRQLAGHGHPAGRDQLSGLFP